MKFVGEYEEIRSQEVKTYEGNASGHLTVPKAWGGRKVIILLVPENNDNGNE